MANVIEEFTLEENKAIVIRGIKEQAYSLIATRYDWQVSKALMLGVTIPQAVVDGAAAIRTWSNDTEAAINACTTLEELRQVRSDYGNQQ